MPSHCNVMDIENAGPDGRLVLRQLPVPPLADGEVLIEVHAAGVNGADLKQLHGQYPGQERAPSVPGLEVSGVIVQCAADVRQWRIGDRVCALVYGGGYAEYCAAPALQCLPIPAGLDFIAAAALPEVVFAVWISVFEQARLQPGETLLVHGGASGIGTMAIQMAKVWGAKVIATGRGQHRCDICLEFGADAAINTSAEDFLPRVLAETGGRGVDVVLDMAGAGYLRQNIDAMANNGRLCFVAADAGRDLALDFFDVSLRGLYLTGVNLRFRSIAEKGRIAGIAVASVWPHIEAGRIRPVVGAVVPMTDAAAALDMLQAGGVRGKVILRIRD